MPRSPFLSSVLLVGALALALAACDSAERSPAATTPADADGVSTPAERRDDAVSPEAWSAQTQDTMATATPEDMAAEGTAAARAMGETCGFTADEMERAKAREPGEQRSAGFEADVAARLPRLRQAQQAQRLENSVAYDENCEFLRFMLDNRD